MEIKAERLYSNENLGKFFLMHYYAKFIPTHAKRTKLIKHFNKKYSTIFKGNRKYEYRDNLVSLRLAYPEYNDTESLEEYNIKFKKKLSYKDITKQKEATATDLIIKQEQKAILNIPARAPSMYFTQSNKGTYFFDTNLQYMFRMRFVLDGSSFEQTLIKIEDLFGNTSLSSVLKALHIFAYVGVNPYRLEQNFDRVFKS